MADSNSIRKTAYHKANQFLECRVQTMGSTLLDKYPSMELEGLTDIQIHIVDLIADYYAVHQDAVDADVEKYIFKKFNIKATVDLDPYPYIQNGTVN